MAMPHHLVGRELGREEGQDLDPGLLSLPCIPLLSSLSKPLRLQPLLHLRPPRHPLIKRLHVPPGRQINLLALVPVEDGKEVAVRR